MLAWGLFCSEYGSYCSGTSQAEDACYEHNQNSADHPLVKQIELERIQRDKSSTSLRAAATRSAKVPYLAILTTPAIWGVWIAATGDLMALQV
ncbi:unnamed protein product [Gongylonema pulchrum]|uniref:C3H1-type domain-containing protein n=1 Tax=Gongylonema pulchrum TaxID=637853 RepID=A0A183DDL8_9BILA|nr:unnamed protein product [Gongylonema pulchrum]